MENRDDEYVIDVYSPKMKWWMRKYDFKEVNGPYGIYYRAKGSFSLIKKIHKKASFRKIKDRYYNKRWSRSNNYRKIFFDNNNEPFRCRYCNKRLKKEQVTVDHIIPVYQAKSNVKARNLLTLMGAKDVNDVKNLAPSCFKCNKAKDAKMGIWFIRGVFGKYQVFWTVRAIFYYCLIIVSIYLVYYLA